MEPAGDLWRPSARSMPVLFSTSVGLIVGSGAPEASLNKSIGFVIGINGTYLRCRAAASTAFRRGRSALPSPQPCWVTPHSFAAAATAAAAVGIGAFAALAR